MELPIQENQLESESQQANINILGGLDAYMHQLNNWSNLGSYKLDNPRNSFYFLTLTFFHVLGQDDENSLGLECCSDIRISSTSYARDHQPASMGNYFSISLLITIYIIWVMLLFHY